MPGSKVAIQAKHLSSPPRAETTKNVVEEPLSDQVMLVCGGCKEACINIEVMTYLATSPRVFNKPDLQFQRCQRRRRCSSAYLDPFTTLINEALCDEGCGRRKR